MKTLLKLALYATLLLMLTGCGKIAPGQKGDQSSGDAESMTRHEFREKLKSLPAAGLGWKYWDGQNRMEHENVGCPILTADLEKAFGKPAKTQTVGKVAVWNWKCKDGSVLVESSQEWNNRGLLGTDGKVKHKPGEYLCVLAVHDM